MEGGQECRELEEYVSRCQRSKEVIVDLTPFKTLIEISPYAWQILAVMGNMVDQ